VCLAGRGRRFSGKAALLFSAAAGLILILAYIIGQGITTLDRLALIEMERDEWQRAPEIIRQLMLHDGSRVADVGCGAGYFALKLSAAVGPEGRVVAVDILRLPLAFLWIRAKQRSFDNLTVIHSEPDDPAIPPVDAVLLANTYHELTNPRAVLTRLRVSLAAGGRLVIPDRGVESTQAEHSADPAIVEAELRRDGFEIVSQEDHFLDQPLQGPWWMIVARKPS
jgi:predicted methyltransferase